MDDYFPRQMSYQDAIRAAFANAHLNPKGARLGAEYDDQQAVDSYVAMFWTRYLGESEKRSYDYGMRLAKAYAQPESPWAQQVLAEWRRNTDQEFRAALADGFPSLQERLWQSVLVSFRTGALVVNRCPKCNRVVRTPHARQCLWCGNDWHE